MPKIETTSYQSACRTSLSAGAVLDDLGARDLGSVVVSERGPYHVVLQAARRRHYPPDLAVAFGIAIVLAVLIGTALSAVVVALLPLAILPALPFILDQRPVLAVSAAPEIDGGAVRVVAHGQADVELASLLDRFLASLPPPHSGDAESAALPPPPAPPPGGALSRRTQRRD